MTRRGALCVATGALVAGCAAMPPTDYAGYRARLPRSIVVLPPLNESTDVTAPYDYLASVSRPLAEAGYYVFPVAVVDAFMKENGLPTAGEMHAVSLAKVHEVLGADAVLYVTIEDWGQKYRIISSDTVVKARAHLVDVGSGETLWTGTVFAQQSSAAGQGDPIGMLVAALVMQVVSSATDPASDLARTANGAVIFDQRRGLLLGRRHPAFESDARGR